MPTKVDESGDPAKPGDETCSVKTYVRNTSAWLVNFASRIETYAVGCGSVDSLKRPDDAISDMTTGYDGQAVGVAPTKGDATSAYRLSGYTAGQPAYQNVSTSTYDQLGRPITTKDALGRQVTTAYTPSDTGYGPLTQKKVTDPKNYSATTEIDPAWGSATKLTDANGKVTEWGFDTLGRLVAVWHPNRVRALGDVASIAYAYGVQQDKATWVRTVTLTADAATYNTAYELSDPTGLKPIIAQEGGQADEAYLKANNAFWSGGPGGWTYNQSRVDTVEFADGSSGALITTTSYGGKNSGKITQTLIKGPKPAPTTKEGEKPIRNSKGYTTWGAGDGYVDPDNIERGPLAMWQKVVIGIAAAVGLAVTAAPVLALEGQACIAAAIACAEGAADLIAGEAAGSGVVVMGVGGGTYLMGADDAFEQVARIKTDSYKNFHDVVVHGTPHDFGRTTAAWENFSHRVLANLVKDDEAWGGGPIRLLSCNTGVDGATAAQNLANKLNVDVRTPNGFVYIYPNGRVVPRFTEKGAAQEWWTSTPGGNKK
ncbi:MULTISPECIES: hypothetical protein [unclassified Streptomyces]|uniref:hypothetical protein n=1 Tax=unclassified Streptomyces TaxID=2593676 RepID=UPI0004BDF5E6|nr:MULTISPECIES: hypothetical protein [unclassified Streptomyces]